MFYDNDFSFAPANGIEATFSRNVFYGNRVEGNWHGIWGGYSFDSWIAANKFARNTEAIAIEHGQDNRITENRFDGDETAIRLWKNPTQDPNWGYPKRRDTRSRDYVIAGNTFVGNPTALKVTETQNVRVLTNDFREGRHRRGAQRRHAELRRRRRSDRPDPAAARRWTSRCRSRCPAASTRRSRIPNAAGARRSSSTSWGPYDWKSPKLWPDGRSDATPLKLKVLGPAGEWKVASVRGATIEPAEGAVPGVDHRHAGSGVAPIDFDVQLTYRGAAVVGPAGRNGGRGRAIHVRLLAVLRAGRLAASATSPSTRRRSRTRAPRRSRASWRARR